MEESPFEKAQHPLPYVWRGEHVSGCYQCLNGACSIAAYQKDKESPADGIQNAISYTLKTEIEVKLLYAFKDRSPIPATFERCFFNALAIYINR